MKNTGFTPGPWIVDRNNVHGGQIATIYGCRDGWAEIWSTEWPDIENQESNIHLMASAPELVVALNDLLNACYRAALHDELSEIIDGSLLDTAEKAINKALGREL